MGTFIESLAGIVVGVTIGFVYSWQLSLCVLAFVPFIMLASMIQMNLVKGQDKKDTSAVENAGKVSCYVTLDL